MIDKDKAKVVRFLPDATIKAVEAGDSIENGPCVTFATKIGEGLPYAGTVIRCVGMSPQWWEMVLFILRDHGSPHGEAFAESIENGFQIMREP